jgi:lysophospholipid acyltransferase (LPLAT)-like uncharacterized protein
VGYLLGLVARLWLATLRLEVDVDPSLAGVADRPWVLAFFHGTQWPLLAWKRRRPTWVMVSWSKDGALQASALGMVGLRVVRGSSSRGGARGLAALVRALKSSKGDAAFAVDGPRGPFGVAKAGARLAARAAGAVLVPMGAAFSSGITLDRAWDRFGIAWPFTRAVVRLGPALDPSPLEGGADPELALAIEAANALACSRLRPREASGALALVK